MIRRRRRPSLEVRFFGYISPEPNSGCWLWTASVDRKGYGYIGLGNGRMGKAHRVSWELHRGPIPEGLFVCHSCDVPSCVNPDHLWIGTHKDNMVDRARKGRGARFIGEANLSSKLTEAQIIAIRSDRRLQKEIAAEYGVRTKYISLIQRRSVWKHVP